MITEYKKDDRVKVIGRIDSNSGGWKGVFTNDMYHTIHRNRQKHQRPVLTVVEDCGAKIGVLCHDANYWPHQVLELV